MPASTVQEFEESAPLYIGNAHFIAELYEQYLKNPDSVDASWVSFFKDLRDNRQDISAEIAGASWSPKQLGVLNVGAGSNDNAKALMEGDDARTLPIQTGSGDTATIHQAALDSVRAMMMIRGYRVRGHLEADLDPLGLALRERHPDLDPMTYGFTEADFDRQIFIDGALGYEVATLGQIVEACRATYCGTLGVEYMHIQDREQRAWIQQRVEGWHNQVQLPADQQVEVLQSLTRSEGFERFLHIKYPGTKRFGLDGGESLIPMLDEALGVSAERGVNEVVVGMAHRGRLNVLANILDKPYVNMLSEFQGKMFSMTEMDESGDVKYHLGFSSDREIRGHNVHLSLTANPSHLEAVNTVVMGKVRAKQDMKGDTERAQVMGVLIHGDAAMAGQGVTAESFMLSQLEGYKTGGTLHVVINNQIGFTTNPSDGRSSPYSSDVAKMVQAPIFHVNGDDLAAVVRAGHLAAEFRHHFQSDVVIDMFCYRRLGHNESDEPSFTQPVMYKAIREHPSVREVYVKHLVNEGVVTQETADDLAASFKEHMEEAFKAAETYRPNKADWLEGAWQGMKANGDSGPEPTTGVDVETLRQIGQAITTVPADFAAHKKIERFLTTRAELIETGENLDWATAEALAFGTLLTENHPIRLSGQDCGRGTFSQRHAVIRNQETGDKYVPLNHIDSEQQRFEVLDSPLAEFSVMGLDYGYSLSNPHALVLWEGQFGDFVNGAQVMIDQFISSGERKWLRMSGLVLLLPHGYEGQGPEHSSARPERFLQLCAEDNMIVANCSTPANYFHILRRQLKRDYRKPLILMTPKSLLRHKECVSMLEEFGAGTQFRPVIEDTAIKPEKARRLVLCTGKVYYDLLKEREEHGLSDVAIVRVEQLYPFPHQALQEVVKGYKKAEVIWCQEEPENMGYWSYIDRRLEAVLTDAKIKAQRPVYAGRPAAASPATGYAKKHSDEQAALLSAALGGK